MIAAVTVPRSIYIVDARPEHVEGLFYDLTAPHALTTSPRRGDVVRHRLQGTLYAGKNPRYRLSCHEVISGETERVDVARHGGRYAMLGEDGWEDAFGDDALGVFVPEILDEASWRYAPCEATVRRREDFAIRAAFRELRKVRIWELKEGRWLEVAR